MRHSVQGNYYKTTKKNIDKISYKNISTFALIDNN